MATRFRAFISYSHQDLKWAKWLHKSIESFHTPKEIIATPTKLGPAPARLAPVFRDQDDLASSSDLSKEIKDALERSEFLIVICSPASAASKWVDREIQTFKELGRPDRILCLLVDGDPSRPNTRYDPFPPSLRIPYDHRGFPTEGQAEPIAADPRRSGDGPLLAKQKILAGLLGVGLDRLRRREYVRRQRRMLAITVASVSITLLTSLLALFALTEKKAAQQSRDQAQDLVTFMLGDLRDRLEPVGRLDALDGVGNKALEYFLNLPESERTNRSTLTSAKAFRQIGEVRIAQGETEKGLAALQEAALILERSPGIDRGSRLYEYGQINYWIADAYFRNFEFDKARAHIDKYLDFSRQLVDFSPDNPDYLLELLYAESNQGTLAYRAHDLQLARQQFHKALAIGKKLAELQSSPENDLELATTISWLGAIEASVGKFRSAYELYHEEQAIYRKLVQLESDRRYREYLANNLRVIAEVQRQSGNVKEAKELSEESTRYLRDLVAYDPQNSIWRRYLALSLTATARNGYSAGIHSAEESHAILSLALEEMVKGAEIDITENRLARYQIEIERARIALNEGDSLSASRLLEEALKNIHNMQIEEKDREFYYLYMEAMYLLSEAAYLNHKRKEGELIATKALATISTLKYADQIQIKAYVSLLSHRAGSPSAESLITEIASSEYRAPIHVAETDTGKWWNGKIY